jgi:hypothetical protein
MVTLLIPNNKHDIQLNENGYDDDGGDDDYYYYHYY